ncbi:hypothetical protein TI39_contig56g00005 [Zymoseptoria brevis]|uniref:Uncharacterized protein n=1 Tax=Zymoseptoria brevis TaxID=1047168 RepID=A0A0F4GZB8_9PEZI|nr:hypothetical protein TI39_contig56g00005 [Zymoseptoria brevis]
MLALTNALLLLTGAFVVQATPSSPPSYPQKCNADRGFAAANLPASYKPTASAYINKTPGTFTRHSTVSVTATKTLPVVKATTTKKITVSGTVTTSTGTSTTTVFPVQPASISVFTTTITGAATTDSAFVTQTTIPQQSTITVTSETVSTYSFSCSTTVSMTFPTQVNYRVRGQDLLAKRDAGPPNGYHNPQIPKQWSSGCPSQRKNQLGLLVLPYLQDRQRLHHKDCGYHYYDSRGHNNDGYQHSGAISSFVRVTAQPVTITSFSTVAGPDPTPATSTSFTTSIDSTCTSTSTAYTYAGGLSCGVAFLTATGSGQVTCTAAVGASFTNSPFRIEGGSEGNSFDGCIVSAPANITTPSGGTHLCDGTNNNANPSPGATLTTDIDSAGREEGFGFDGTYSNQFQDFFISSISSTTQSGNQFWGVLRDRVFTARGGCQEQASPVAEGLWAFDAFAPNRVILNIQQDYQIVRAGETGSVTVTVFATNPNIGNQQPAMGATLGTGAIADAIGNIQLEVPQTPGCYQYKAERSNAIRSNAFYLTVLPAY